ncbi:uncharacterized protein V3H86_013606 [Mergus octosetaceus]
MEERRRQNIERMNEEMEKIAEYERNQRDGLQDRNPVRSFLDDPRRRGPAQDERHGGSRRHGRNWGGTDFEGVRAGLEQRGRRRAAPTMTGRERAEYARWKQEREEIDQPAPRPPPAAHRQWRREWDADKTDGMFNDAPDAEHEPPKRPPKPPTFGEFLPAPRRKRQSHGRNPSTKPYSMHDDRWEEEKEPATQPGGADGKGAQELETAPGGTPLQPPPGPEEDEDEDEWEDVSEEDEEEEEEEDDEGSSPPSPAKAEPPLLSPRPIRDWGEEMDLAPPPPRRPEGCPPPRPPPPAEPAGLSPTEQLGPPGGLSTPPQDTPQHPTQETVQQDPEGPPPGTVEITDFQRVRFPLRSPPQLLFPVVSRVPAGRAAAAHGDQVSPQNPDPDPGSRWNPLVALRCSEAPKSISMGSKSPPYGHPVPYGHPIPYGHQISSRLRCAQPNSSPWSPAPHCALLLAPGSHPRLREPKLPLPVSPPRKVPRCFLTRPLA